MLYFVPWSFAHGRQDHRAARTDLEVDVAGLKDEWANIPDLIEARLRLTDSRVARLSSDMVGVKRSVAELSGKVEALPRTLAEMRWAANLVIGRKVDALPANVREDAG